MRILVHEFGGYPFPVELSAELARRGHRVTHSWCASLVDTAGSANDLSRGGEHPATLDFAPLSLGRPLDKYNYVRRFRQERRYGRLAVELTRRVEPDVVLAANVPLDAQRLIVASCRKSRVPFVFWLQDLIGIGTEDLLRARIPVGGPLIGRHYARVEAELLRRSDAIVAITDDFLGFIERAGVEPERATTIENWAPIDELPIRPKDNEWAVAEDLDRRFVFAYTGALGMKQDRDLLVELAARLRSRDDVRVLVLTGAPELAYLRGRARELGLENLLLRDYVPFDRLPDVLGAADVLIASIHRDAGRYSVPSKVLSYLCGGRPLLVSVPADNLAGRIVAREEAGAVVEPGDLNGFLAAAERMVDSPEARARMGANGRRYAEASFRVEPIADRFEAVLRRAGGAAGASPATSSGS